MGSRLRARESAALATSVHLVSRPRPDDAPVGDWADVLRELPPRVGDWMERLQGEGVRGADLVNLHELRPAARALRGDRGDHRVLVAALVLGHDAEFALRVVEALHEAGERLAQRAAHRMPEADLLLGGGAARSAGKQQRQADLQSHGPRIV